MSDVFRLRKSAPDNPGVRPGRKIYPVPTWACGNATLLDVQRTVCATLNGPDFEAWDDDVKRDFKGDLRICVREVVWNGNKGRAAYEFHLPGEGSPRRSPPTSSRPISLRSVAALSMSRTYSTRDAVAHVGCSSTTRL